MVTDAAEARLAEFETLLRPQLEAAYRVAYRMTGDGAEAEDLVQEASLLAWRGFESFERGTNFRGWFLRILTNAFVSRYRKSRREGQVVAIDDVPELYLWRKFAATGADAALADPAGAFLAQLDGERINGAIAALPEEYRVVAALYFMKELSYQEIVDMIGVPIGTVRSRLFRARRHLQRSLWDLGVAQGLVSEPEAPQ